MMKPVLQAMAEGVDAVLRQLAADLVAERTVERREHRLRIPKCERQQRQCAGRRDLAERRPRHKEFERAAAHIGKHLGSGPSRLSGNTSMRNSPPVSWPIASAISVIRWTVGLAAGWLRPKAVSGRGRF